jgi:hypothetical protein
MSGIDSRVWARGLLRRQQLLRAGDRETHHVSGRGFTIALFTSLFTAIVALACSPPAARGFCSFARRSATLIASGALGTGVAFLLSTGAKRVSAIETALCGADRADLLTHRHRFVLGYHAQNGGSPR